nr:GDP-mannose 4,6-dehydratase [Nitrosopumilus maritimus]
MKVLLTGANGFIGSHLADYLYNNYDIFLAVREFSNISNINHLKDKVNLSKLDITNFKEIQNLLNEIKPDVVIHLAGETSHSKSFEDPIHDVEVNSKSTLYFLESIRKLQLKCTFILGSTFIVIGKPISLPVNEKSVCIPTTIYATNRLSSEHFCKIYHQVYDMDCRIFRITNSFGPREKTISSKNAVNFLIYQAYSGKEITVFNDGEFFRDLIYVKDVVSGIETIMKNGKNGELYWISSHQKTWFKEFGKILHELTSSPLNFIPPPEYTKKVDVGNFLADNSKLKSLGWEPKYSLRDGIIETLDYFKNKKL